MIYVSDITSVAFRHEQFNKSFLDLLTKTYPSEPIVFLGESEHLRVIKEDSSHITYREIPVYDKRGGFKEFIRAYHQFQTLRKLIRLTMQHADARLYILLIHPFAHFLYKLFGDKRAPIYIVMHGELESLKFNKHFLNKIWGFFQKQAFAKKSPNATYIILGKSIYRNLIDVLPSFSSQNAIVLDHPYPFSEPPLIRKDSRPLVLSTLGVATKAKNTHYFFQLAEQAFARSLKYKFNVCGKVYPNMQRFLNEHVNYKPGFGILTREELDRLTLESSFTVFYYENSDYSLCSSGSFWDAINTEIPLLYVHNDYFDYYAGIAGPIGIPFKTPEDLNNYVLNDLDPDIVNSNTYKQFIANIKAFKNGYMSTENLSNQLRHPIIPAL
ncbi:hypothetical protein [Dyadobacter sp.]|uniref:hypothetical protein n=1 Tax=Dyadobacter sp. TaxID=1914288 RepID=UPI003F7120FA